MKVEKIIIWIVSSLLLISCELTPFEEELNPVKIEQTNVLEESNLFVPDEDNKIYTFETNDTKYIGKNGYTLWTVPFINADETFKPISVEVVKESGRTEPGFGIVFCSQKLDNKAFMLTVLVNANGYYAIGKVTDGVFHHINEGWKSSDYIFRGIGAKNILSVIYDTTTKSFILKINDYEITTFTVAEKFSFANSRSGFAVVIGSNESFPNKSVKVTFENK